RRARTHHGGASVAHGSIGGPRARRLRARVSTPVRSRRLLWVLLLGLAVTLLVLIVRHDDGTIAGLESHDFAALAIKLALLVFFGGFVIAMFRYRFAEALRAALFCEVIALCLDAG